MLDDRSYSIFLDISSSDYYILLSAFRAGDLIVAYRMGNSVDKARLDRLDGDEDSELRAREAARIIAHTKLKAHSIVSGVKSSLLGQSLLDPVSNTPPSDDPRKSPYHGETPGEGEE